MREIVMGISPSVKRQKRYRVWTMARFVIGEWLIGETT